MSIYTHIHRNKYQDEVLWLTKEWDLIILSGILISHQASCYLVV